MAIRRLRCGSSVYIHKKSSPWASAALPGCGSSPSSEARFESPSAREEEELGVEGAETESSSVVTPELTTDSSLGELWRGRCFSFVGDGSAEAEETVADIATDLLELYRLAVFRVPCSVFRVEYRCRFASCVLRPGRFWGQFLGRVLSRRTRVPRALNCSPDVVERWE